MTTTTNHEFEAWYAQCDQICADIAGIGVDDLTDGPSYDSWEAGYSPCEYVLERLKDAGLSPINY